jgi:hypothetical protein
LGIVAGAVYRPVAEIVPTVVLPPAVPFTLQVTAVFVEFATVAVNCVDPEGATVTLAGDTLTVTGGGAGGCTVTVAVPTADGLAALVACTVTVAGLGIAAGALYIPEAETVPTVEFPPVTPFTLHVTAVFVEFVTVALNWRVCVTGTDALDGDTLTITGGADVTLRLTGVLVVPPSPLLTTTIGIFLPTCVASAIPVAFNEVADTKVVAIGTPPNCTVELAPKFAPFREILNVPTGTDAGEVLQSCTGGWVTVIVTVPNLLG